MNDYSYYMKLYFSLAIRYSTIFATELQHSCYIAPNHYQQHTHIILQDKLSSLLIFNTQFR